MFLRKFVIIWIVLAHVLRPVILYAGEPILTPPGGQVVSLSPAFNPPVLKGIRVYPRNPLRFDFILDKGDERITNDQIKSESTRLIKYFFCQPDNS